jgi:PST family polysaccharide transporter
MSTTSEVRGQAVRGIAWNIATGIGVRALQLAGTLAITYFVRKDALGEVANASVVATNAHAFSSLGVPHYLVSRKTDRAAAWHGTVLLTLSGILALALTVALQVPLAGWLKSPELGRYLPWLALSTLISRIAVIPERLLQQQLKFRQTSHARAIGELTYTVVALGCAIAGAGGMAVVAANLARSGMQLATLSAALSPREWLTPHPLEKRVVRDILSFGLPMGAAYWLTFAARSADNLVVSAMFGASVVAVYNLAYNLADIPASQVGEQVGDVLVPSFVHLTADRQKAGVVRATGLLSLIVFPLAVGLGVVGPMLATTLLPAAWSALGPMLTVLSVLSVVRPIGWTIGSYLQTTQRSGVVMGLSAFRLVALLAAVGALGQAFGPLGACAGVGVAFTLHALASAIYVVRRDGLPGPALLAAILRPLAACVLLALAALGAGAALPALGRDARFVALAAQIVAGTLGYLAGVWLFARPLAKDLLRLVADLRRRRSAPAV